MSEEVGSSQERSLSSAAEGTKAFRSDAEAYREGIIQGLELAEVICLRLEAQFLSPEYATDQPLSSFSERFACRSCAEEIRRVATRPGLLPIDGKAAVPSHTHAVAPDYSEKSTSPTSEGA